MRFWLLPALGLFLAPFFADSFLPHHDSLSVYQYFAVYYRQYFLTGEGPLWLQAGYEGIPSDYFHWTFLSASGLLSAFVGKILGVTATVPLFSFSIALEILIFVTGLHAFVRLVTNDERAALFTALTALCTIYWDAQIFFNLRFLLFTPWFLWSLFKFAKGGELGYFLLLLPLFILGLVGELPYLVGLYFWLYLGISVAVLLKYRPWESRGLRVQILRPRNLALALFGLALVAGYGYCLGHMLDGTVNYNSGRDPLTQKVLFGSFLHYGSPSPWKPLEFLLGLPQGSALQGEVNFTSYFGTTAFLLAGYAVFFVSGFTANLFKVLAAVSLWIAIPVVNHQVAWFLYQLPLMGYFRHLGAFILVARFSLLVLAGLGFAELKPAPRFWIGVLAASALLAGGVFGLNSGVWPYETFFREPATVREKILPFVALLVSGLVLLALALKARRWGGYVLVGLALIEGLFFQSLMAGYARPPRPALATTGYSVKDYPRTVKRLAFGETSPERRDLEAFESRWPFTEAMAQTFLDLEMCESPSRQNVANRNLDDLFRSRAGLPRGGFSTELPTVYLSANSRWLNNRAPVPDPKDLWLNEAMGCGREMFRFARRPRLFPSAAEAGEAVRRAKPGDGDIIEGPAEGPVLENEGVVLVTDADANGARLTVDSKGDSWLIFGAGFHPGWKVWIDQAPSSLHRVNFSYLGVRVPSGVHDVRFRFEGSRAVYIRKCLEWVLILSTLAVIFCGLFLFVKDDGDEAG